MRVIFIVALLLYTYEASACISDASCGANQVCVQPSGAVGVEGVCVTPTDEFGTPQTVNEEDVTGPHQISGCEFDTDCDPGFSCMKQGDNIDGICMR